MFTFRCAEVTEVALNERRRRSLLLLRTTVGHKPAADESRLKYAADLHRNEEFNIKLNKNVIQAN